MAGNSEFWAQYKHPLWQKKRLEVLDQAGYACGSCGSDEKQLHVHHRYYIAKRKIWDYPEDCYECLCEDCHKEFHNLKDRFKSAIQNLDRADMERVIGFIAGMQYDYKTGNLLPGETYELRAHSWEEAAGVAAYFRRDVTEIVDLAIANNGLVWVAHG